jgi:PST family polysaccharide transporter
MEKGPAGTPIIKEKDSYRYESILNPELDKSDLKIRSIRSAGITITERLSEYAINTISVIVLARLLTPADFGLVAMVASIAGIFSILRDLGLSDVTVQAPELNHTQVSTLFWVNSLFNTGIAILLIVCSPLIAKFYKEPKLIGITIVYSLSFIFIGISTQHFALLKRSMRFGCIAIVGISSTILSVAIAIIMAVNKFGYWSIITRQVTLALLSSVGAWILLSWKPGRPAFTKEVWRLIRMGLNIVGFFIVNYLAHNLDKTLIGWRLGAESLGFYDRAFQLSVMPVSVLAMPLYAVAVSTLSKLKKESDRFVNYYLNALKVLSFFGFPISVFLCLMSKDLIFLLLGPRWEQAAAIFRILSVSIWGSIIYGTHGWIHVSLGRTDRWFKWGLISTPILIFGYFISLPFGTRAVAASYAIILSLLTFPSILYAGRPINLRIDHLLSHLWRYLFSAVLSGVLLFFASDIISNFNIWIRLSASLILYGTSYLIIMISLYKGLTPIKEILSLFKSIIQRTN